jgi:hypothetical protein
VLLEALQHPSEANSDAKARQVENALPEPPAFDLKTEHLLGPARADFADDAAWIEFKTGVRALFADKDKVAELQGILNTYEDAARMPWIALLFHPRHWRQLEEKSLVGHSDIETLADQAWAKLMALPEKFVEVVTIGSTYYYRRQNIRVPWIPVMQIALSVHAQGNLRESRLLAEMLSRSSYADLDSSEADELFASAAKLDTLPNSWAVLLMALGLFSPNVDIRLLANVWAALNEREQRHLWALRPIDDRSRGTAYPVLQKLIDDGSEPCLLLASELALHFSELNAEVSARLNERLAKHLRDLRTSSLKRTAMINALISTRSTIEEARLYADRQWLNSIESDAARFVIRAADRITALPQTLTRESYVELQSALEEIVGYREEYPLLVSSAALNALAQIELGFKEPLKEQMWQHDDAFAA